MGAGQCGRQNNGPPRYAQVPVPRSCEYYLMWQKGLVNVNEIKDLEMRRLSCVVQVDLMGHNDPYKFKRNAGSVRVRGVREMTTETGVGMM